REVKITVLTSAANKNLNALLGAQTESLQVVVQVSAEEVAHLMSRVSLIICTASTAAIEACAVGVPMVVGYSAENQRGIYQGMMQLNACIGIGSFHNMDDDALLSAVRILLDSKEESQRMVQRQRIAIDQQSNHRITEAIHRTQQQAESFWWREVRQQDMMLLFEWTNDPEVRANSFQSEPINLETHERWFKGILENDHAAFFLFFQGRTPIGQLRLVKRDGLCALSYSVSKSSRGKGFGKAILKSSLPLASQCWQDVQEIVGYVKPTNEASQRAFLALGFSIKESNPDEILFAHAL
ncbi:MAG: GNAT family N-acetyltransferase, partial [Flavobacteriales bacterium]